MTSPTPSITPHCTSCGASIRPGAGHYSTPHGLFCISCGLRFPIIPDLIEVTGQDQQDEEAEAPYSVSGAGSREREGNKIRRQS